MLLSSARDPVMDDLVKLDVEYSVAFWDNSVTLWAAVWQILDNVQEEVVEVEEDQHPPVIQDTPWLDQSVSSWSPAPVTISKLFWDVSQWAPP